jgi:hypothetical protein
MRFRLPRRNQIVVVAVPVTKNVAERRGVGYGEIVRGRGPAMPDDEGASRKGDDDEERQHQQMARQQDCQLHDSPTTMTASMSARTYPATLFGQWTMGASSVSGNREWQAREFLAHTPVLGGSTNGGRFSLPVAPVAGAQRSRRSRGRNSCRVPKPRHLRFDLLKTEQDRIGIAEHVAKDELQSTEGDLEGWQDVLRTAIRLAGNCHAAYLKARPSVRRRFNVAVLEAVYIRNRKIGRVEFSEVFAPLFSRPSSNKALKVDPRVCEVTG